MLGAPEQGDVDVTAQACLARSGSGCELVAPGEHATGSFVERATQRESLRGGGRSGDGPGAPVDVTDVGEAVEVMRVPEPGGHLGVAGDGELGVPHQIELERGSRLAVA